MTGSRDEKGPRGDEGRRAKRALLIVMAGAFCLGAAFLAAAMLLASCSASVSSAIRADGGARISIQAEVPSPLAAKFRRLAAGSGSPPTGPLFDADAIRRSIAERPGLSLVEIAQPSPDSIRAVLSARSLEELASSPDIKDSGLISISRGAGWIECRFRLERGKAKTLASLFPGIDPYLVEALSPPALEEDPVTVEEYKTMLNSVLGEKAMPAMASAALSLSISAPGEVLSSSGGILAGSTLTERIPIIDALALEKPIELRIRWKAAP
jgi:hypothetical protein